MSDTTRLPFRTPSGLIAGTRWAFKVELSRLFKVAERTTRALYFAERGRRLRTDYGVMVHSNETLSDLPSDLRNMIDHDVIQPLATTPAVTIGGTVFTYRVQFAKEDPDLTWWVQTYYGGVHFLCLTLPAPVGARELFPRRAIHTGRKSITG